MVHVIFDNGAGKLKYGVAGNDKIVSVTNSCAKVNKSMQYLIADQVDDFLNGSLLLFNRPFDRGYLNNWQSEIDIWTRIFGGMNVTCNDDILTMTEPLLTPTTIQNDNNEVVFEYFGFKEHLRRPSVFFSANDNDFACPTNNTGLRSCIVVDSGFSYTHIVPFINGMCQKQAIRRVNIGGKLLTNYLKEVVSYRQWNMMDEFVLMNQVKESLCYISSDFSNDLKKSRPTSRFQKTSVVDYKNEKLKKLFALPDFKDINKGYVLSDDFVPGMDDQVLAMESERFSVPELLFNPSDIGIEQAGVVEATWQSLQQLNTISQGLAASNIILTGGNCNLPQFKERYEIEVRQIVPDVFPTEVYLPDSPELTAWRGASKFIRDETNRGTLFRHSVTRKDYLEFGHHYCNEKFNTGW